MKSGIKLILRNVIISLAAIIVISLFTRISLASLLFVPAAFFLLSILYAALLNNKSRNAIVWTAGIAMAAVISLSYWQGLDIHLLRPLYHGTWHVGQGHKDNKATAESNAQADKTEKAILADIWRLDSLASKNIHNPLLLKAYADTIKMLNASLKELKTNIGESQQVVGANPQYLINEKWSRIGTSANRPGGSQPILNVNDFTTWVGNTALISFTLKDGQRTSDIFLENYSTGQKYSWEIRVNNIIRVDTVTGKAIFNGTGALNDRWWPRFSLEGVAGYGQTEVDIKIFPYDSQAAKSAPSQLMPTPIQPRFKPDTSGSVIS